MKKQDTCKACGADISLWEEYSAMGGREDEGPINTWWAHVVHPADGHDAEPAEAEDNVIELDIDMKNMGY